MILDEIIASKKLEIERAKQNISFDKIKKIVKPIEKPHQFIGKLQNSSMHPALIAELKKKSPSKGLIRADFDPARLAQELEKAGACALSILTDEPFFGGNLEFLKIASKASRLPLLRKDFILDEYQIYESACFNANAILLIVQLLSKNELSRYLEISKNLGLDALVEIHNENDLNSALEVGSSIIGINQRDLWDFSMHPGTTQKLISKIPKDKLIVAESGLASKKDILKCKEIGVHAVLIGDAIMSSSDVGSRVKEMFDGI
jgi:indole-3-glycerol phosphate synthase